LWRNQIAAVTRFSGIPRFSRLTLTAFCFVAFNEVDSRSQFHRDAILQEMCLPNVAERNVFDEPSGTVIEHDDTDFQDRSDFENLHEGLKSCSFADYKGLL
jgi:hypothetical protein